MAENYDLIFGQSASSQYAWSNSDYQNGWQTVGSTPPTAEQFDALQRRSDTKAKDLNNRLSPLETTASKALARVTPAANKLPYFNSSNSATTTAISDFIKTLLDDKDAKTARATVGAPSTTGGGASGTWDINISGNAKTATTATTANTATNATHASSADSATNADKVDGVHAASLFYNKGDWDADNWATIGTYEVDQNPPVSGAYGWGQVISSSTKLDRFQLYAAHRFEGTGHLYYRTGFNDEKEPWNTILDSENYNLFAPTKTGNGASGTWGIDISGNAATATNADKLDGYHASDIINKISAANTGGIVAASLTKNGYVKFANGLTIQWGEKSWSGGTTEFFTGYSINMPNETSVVVMSPTGTITAQLRSSSTGTNGFTTVPSVPEGKLKWLAIGY